MTNRILFEAAAGVLNFDWPNFRQDGVTTDTIPLVLEQSTGFRYRAAASQDRKQVACCRPTSALRCRT